MELVLTSKHELLGSGYFIGIDNENISEQLIINIEPEELLNKWAYLEFQVNEDDKYNTPKLDIIDKKITYDLPNGLLKKGYVKVQVIFRDDTNFVWKSFERKFHISDAINACQNLPDEYPDFITEAQKLLDEISVDADKVDQVLATETARVEAENIRVSNENTRIDSENARISAETERSNKEVERKSNEEIRQQNETQRVSAEATRQTKFNTWENTLGVLDNLSNALKNKVSGEVIRVDDVSPVEHNAKVKVSRKNNLLPFPYPLTNRTVNGITFTVNTDGTVNVQGTATALVVASIFNGNLALNGTYTISGVNGGSGETYYMQPYIDKKAQATITDGSTTYNFNGNLTLMNFYVRSGAAIDTVLKPQLELGDAATEYTPYIDPTSVVVTVQDGDGISKTYTPNADGTLVVASTAPTMTILTDKEVNIEAEYNQDINVVLKNIQDKINALK